MAQKRKISELKEPSKALTEIPKAKKGFTVGPGNLPDGTYRRKGIFPISGLCFEAKDHEAQKIKSNLIHKAKVKKSYAKLKEREKPAVSSAYDPYATMHEEVNAEKVASPTLDIHPERQQMLDNREPSPVHEAFHDTSTNLGQHKPARSRPRPFVKESQIAQHQREEAEARRKAIEESQRQRQEKIANRERMRQMTAAARKPNRNGQRRLGRESKILLEKVKIMTKS